MLAMLFKTVEYDLGLGRTHEQKLSGSCGLVSGSCMGLQ